MGHVDYQGWADFIITLFKKYGDNIHNVVDGGCGTGTLASILEKKGYRVAGFDHSLEMIRLAHRKSSIPYWQGDLRSISLCPGWDVFLCLYDTIQYLTPEEIKRMLLEVKSILKEGGILIFDVVTENHVLRYWANYTEIDSDKNWRMIRRSWFDRNGRLQHTEFEISFLEEKKVYQEHHVQRIYKLEEVEQIGEKTGFHILGRFDDFTLNPGNEKSDRVHFVFQRRAS